MILLCVNNWTRVYLCYWQFHMYLIQQCTMQHCHLTNVEKDIQRLKLKFRTYRFLREEMKPRWNAHPSLSVHNMWCRSAALPFWWGYQVNIYSQIWGMWCCGVEQAAASWEMCQSVICCLTLQEKSLPPSEEPVRPFQQLINAPPLGKSSHERLFQLLAIWLEALSCCSDGRKKNK